MGIYRKNLKIQSILFFSFIIISINELLNEIITSETPWNNYAMLGIAAILIGWIIVIYKKEDGAVVKIEEKEYKRIRMLLYVYFFIYVVSMLLPELIHIDRLLVAIVTSILLALTATYGFILHLILLNRA